jgi:phage-related minor tail protein
MADSECCCEEGDGLGRAARKYDEIERRLRDLDRSAGQFARTITGAFAQGVASGKSFDDILKRLYLRLSDLALRAAFKPLESALATGFGNLFGGLFGLSAPKADIAAARGAIKPFAGGGVIGTPTYFPMASGGLGLAGEAGPEAILPLTRTADGRLGVAGAGGGTARIVVNIATPDAESFRRSEVYVTGQIARAVARGQRGL